MKKSEVDNIIIYSPDGHLDIVKSDNIEEIIENDLQNESKHVIFNMKDVSSMSSSFIRVVVSTRRKLYELPKKMDVSICCLNDFCKNIIHILNIESLLNIFETEAEAIRYLRNK